jgi:penicillin-binding protein 1C
MSHIKKYKITWALVIGIVIYMAIPFSMFDDPYATIITAKDGALLSAKIADDGQWRFPQVDSVPKKFETAIRYFEDEYFFLHPGVNPFSLIRACWQNLSSGKTISGGSTITMQVVRLMRKNPKRTYYEKLIELAEAIKLDVWYRKESILKLYISHAPYGGNVVGAEAAAWRYFKRPIHQLSWAEYTTLAVLPNAPSLIHPGKNRKHLLQKRNRLLKKLYINHELDSISYSLALMEDIPSYPNALPEDGYHLLDFALKSGKKGERVQTTIDHSIQTDFSNKLDNYIRLLSQNDIRNACAVVVSLDEGEVVAYIGNTKNPTSGARYVDLIQSQRSSGSILKPLLYGKAIDAGLIHTSTLLRDVPISIDKFSPANFDKSFDGIIRADKALARSLNIPATLLLREYGIVPFYEDLKHFGFTSINRSADNYGLTLILGGAEVTLWDLVKVYTHQAISLKEFVENKSGVEGLKIWENSPRFHVPKTKISEGTWWLISEALTDVQRPDLDQHWRLFSSSQKIAWKTGTSHGFRDAWAVGYNANFLVTVWVGNAEGEGRPGLTGVSAAAPLMFQFFQFLKGKTWFDKPEMSLKYSVLCTESGMAPNPFCPAGQVELPINGKVPNVCDYHQNILINNKKERVYIHCAETPVKDTVWFHIDPIAGYYYKKTHQNYEPLPPFSQSCQSESEKMLDIIYPSSGIKIIVPKNLNGEEEKVLFEAAHLNKEAIVYWHLDDKFVGKTQSQHQLSMYVSLGKHVLLVIDDKGNSVKNSFSVYK